MAAKLKIEIDVPSVRRALGDIAASAIRENGRMKADSEKSIKRTTEDYIAAARRRIDADKAVTEARKALEEQIKTTTANAAKASVESERQALNERVQLLQQAVREVERATSRESQIRERARQQEATRARNMARGDRIVSTAGAVIGAGFSAGVQVAGQVADVRQADRVRDRTMNNAFFQAGADARQASVMRQQIYDFAVNNRMDSSELAAAAAAAQTEFSVFGNSRSTQSERDTRMRAFQRNARLARDTGQSVGEVTRIGGMLSNLGLNEETQRQTLLALTGFAQQGSIELGDVTRTAMAPMQARIGQAIAAVGPNATNDQRQAAVQRAVAQTFAEMEVGKGLGYTPRALGNVMSVMGQALQDPTTQGKMLDNIRNRYGNNSVQEQILFENRRDSQGRMRMQLRSEYQDALGLSEGLMQAFGGNAAEAMSVFSGGGRRNPQSLQRNWRNILQAYMGSDVEGMTGTSRIRQMISGAGIAFTQQDVDRGAEIFGNDNEAILREREERANAQRRGRNGERPAGALGSLDRLSNQWKDFQATSPIASSLMTTVLPALGAAGGTAFWRSSAGASVRGFLGRAAPYVGRGAGALGFGLMAGDLLSAGTEWAANRFYGQSGRSSRSTSHMSAAGAIQDLLSTTGLVQSNGFGADFMRSVRYFTGTEQVQDNSNNAWFERTATSIEKLNQTLQSGIHATIDPISVQQALNQQTSQPPATPAQ